MAITKDHSLDRAHKDSHALSYVGVAADAEEILKGSFVQFTAGGYAVIYGDPLGVGPIRGVAEKNVPDQTGASNGDATLRLIVGMFERPINQTTPVTDADMFRPVYAWDNFEVTADSTKPALGILVGIDNDADKCTVLITASGTASSGATAVAAAPLGEATEADGTALAAWADGVSTTPGLNMGSGSKFKNIRWNNDAAPDPIAISFLLPFDLDSSRDIVVFCLAAKEAAGGDTPTLTIAAYFATVGTAYDADADAGGVTNAMTDTAKDVQLLARTILAANVPASTAAAPSMLTLHVKPTAGSLGTDDLLLGAVFVAYSSK
jgi:hypothetical protein